MGNFDTIDAITDNIETVLRGLGAVFAHETYDDTTAIPASLLPHGQIFYDGEGFGYNHGQKPLYAEGEFLIRVTIKEGNPRLLAREEQKWVHLIRDGLTVNALNIGYLVSSKLVSLVETVDVRIDHRSPSYGVVNYRVKIRYRES